MIKRLQSRVFIGEWSSRQEKIVLYKESRYTYKVFNIKVYNPNRYISWLSRQRIRKKAILISRITLYFRKFSKEFVGFSYLTFAFQLELWPEILIVWLSKTGVWRHAKRSWPFLAFDEWAFWWGWHNTVEWQTLFILTSNCLQIQFITVH